MILTASIKQYANLMKCFQLMESDSVSEVGVESTSDEVQRYEMREALMNQFMLLLLLLLTRLINRLDVVFDEYRKFGSFGYRQCR